MELWIGALNLGFLYAFMTVGVYLTFRVLDFPDITVDGSFTSGAATAAVLIVSGWNPFAALIAAFIVGAIAGYLTGVIYTGLKINGLLAGILVMIGLYSINLHIMGKSNIPLLSEPGFTNFFEGFNPGMTPEIWLSVCLAFVILLFWLLASWLLKTDMGITLRAAGNNPDMISANGVNVAMVNILGIAVSNGLVGLSGGLVAQYQGFADIGMGIGTVIVGLAAVIIGESILKLRSVFAKVLSAVIGSIIFRFMIAFALYAGMNPIDLKLLTALFVLLTLFVSKMSSQEKKRRQMPAFVKFIAGSKKRAIGFAGAAALAAVIFFGVKGEWFSAGTGGGHRKIGIIQINDNGLLDITREAFLKEMAEIGYIEGKNITIDEFNANGDMPTVNSILDKIQMEDYDLIVSLSTPCTQAAINKIKNKPIVFCTVANPFIIKAGKTDTDHLPNVTGVYGWVPMGKTLEIAREFFPENMKIGALWDPAHENSVFNVERLKKAVSKYENIEFFGTNVSNSSEVYQAASSLANKGIDIFILPPDNIVYSAFDAVVKASQHQNIPIILSDISRLGDGALAAYGYDYNISGIQGAHLVDRIFRGENPKDIPFERYKKIAFGLNIKQADKLNINIPAALYEKATGIVGRDLVETGEKKKVGIVQFAMEPNVELCKKGILTAMKANGYEDGKNVEIIYKNAQADFSMINSIMQDFVRRDVDVIIPLSTPCVQSAVQNVGGREKPVVCFTYIFDPYKIGAAKTPDDHIPNMTGVSCFPPSEKIFDLMKEMFPGRKKVGIVWNSSEANSEAVIDKMRPYAKSIGLEIVEATVTSPAEVLEASRSLLIKGAEIFLNPGDNTLNVSFDSFAKVAADRKIPVFSVDADFVNNGAVVGLGPNYFMTGFHGGEYLTRIFNGEKPAVMPILQTEETVLYLNLSLAKKLGFEIKEEIIKRADLIIRDSIQNESEEKRVAVVHFSDNALMTDTENGLNEELEKDDFIRKYNLKIDRYNAQGDFSTATQIAKKIVADKYDYIITLSTPVLQVTANENKTIPHVFGAVTSPYVMGIAKDSANHIPNITGVATLQPVGSTIKLIRAVCPKAKKIGIIWNPAEACSEVCTKNARRAAKVWGFELLEASVSNTNEIIDALKSLIDKDIDLFLTSGDNTVNHAVEMISDILRKKKIPYFTNTFSDVEKGAFLTIGADYEEVGRETAKVAKKVISGENPKDLPIENFVPEKIYINLALAEEYGITIPERIIKKANKIKRQ